MKTRDFYTSIIALFALCLIGCTQDMDESARYVFKEKTAVDFMRSHPDTYGMFLDLTYQVPVSDMSSTTVGQLLSARGNYTIFAPSNEAIQRYLDSMAVKEDFLTAPSFDAFTDSVKLDSVRQLIVKSCIIDAGDYGRTYVTGDFPTENGGEFGMACMNDRKMTVRYENSDIYFNRTCRLNPINQDIEVSNGIVHQVEDVICPSATSAGDYLLDIILNQKEGYLVMARAIQAAGLLDTLKQVRDEVYEKMYKQGDIPDYSDGYTLASAPSHKLIGFTLFLEPDSLWQSYGIDPKAPDMLEKLVQWIQDQHQYSDEDQLIADKDYENPKNLLYQWMTYHILPMRVPANMLIIHENEIGYNLNNPGQLGNPVTDYLSPMGKRRLLKVYQSAESNGVFLNRFPKLDDGRRGTGHELSCDADKTGCMVMRDHPMAITSDIQNANIYPLDKPLSFNDEVRDDLHRERIRFDFMTLLPELTTNDIRKKQLIGSVAYSNEQYATIPPSNIYNYCQELTLSDDSYFRYWNAYGVKAAHLYCDEVLIFGHGDITFRLPPVPRSGMYEIRYGYLANNGRDISQIYFGTDPKKLAVTGIPMDMRINGETYGTGWELDTEDEDYNAEMDKKMRNNTYMKGAKSVTASGDVTLNSRTRVENMRRILTRQYMEPNKSYYLRMKSVLNDASKCIHLDYMELCPKEVYDNPEKPEDIW